jgi:acyl-CoA synthetase (AMP-forming)/AMP-acid ligase II
MTEALPVSWVSLEDKLAHLGDGDLAGEPCPGVHIRIAADGEILVSGPNLCRGYLGMPPATEVATGDIGRLDGGRLVLLGRKKDMIIRGSYNIYPALVEDTVAAVRGVRRCALIGLYDDRRADEEVVLAVEPQDGADRAELRRRVKREIFEGPRRIDIYARPDRIVFTRIPLAGRSHKPDKIALRKLVMELIRC